MGNLRAGASKVDITPYVGIWLCGFGARFKPSENIYDNLHARAIVFDDGKENFCMVTCDLLTLDQSSVETIRKMAQDMTGLKGENIFISTTHTHSGPLSGHLKGFGPLDTAWVEILEKKIVGAISLASRNMQDVAVSAGKGQANVNLNRRGKSAIDRELGVIRVNRSNGNPLAVIMTYPCHPVIVPWNTHSISADYPGIASALIEKVYNDAIGLFFTGTCGDINPVSICREYSEVKRIGTIVGAEALRVSEELTSFNAEVELKATKEMLVLKSQEIPSAEKLQEIVDAGSQMANIELDWEYGWAKDALEYAKAGKLSDDVPVEIQVLTLGNEIALVGIPGEVFVEIGLAIKEKSPFKWTFPIECTNGCVGYMPTRTAFDEGGYEPAMAFKLFGIYPMDMDVAEKVIDSASKMVDDLRHET
ncbi:MAG: neutral/alkaline non-lysosomal ceramidase N-terminal domain-containing protein [Candidatus Poribacteria bacterium]